MDAIEDVLRLFSLFSTRKEEKSTHEGPAQYLEEEYDPESSNTIWYIIFLLLLYLFHHILPYLSQFSSIFLILFHISGYIALNVCVMFASRAFGHYWDSRVMIELQIKEMESWESKVLENLFHSYSHFYYLKQSSYGNIKLSSASN